MPKLKNRYYNSKLIFIDHLKIAECGRLGRCSINQEYFGS
jgi:hypothetical protein